MAPAQVPDLALALVTLEPAQEPAVWGPVSAQVSALEPATSVWALATVSMEPVLVSAMSS
jgi:hypothetical protein